MQTTVLTDKQYKSLSKKILNSLKRNYRIIPLNSLKHPDYILKTPVYISIEQDKDMVIASLDDIEAFAYADTEFEAINLLCEEIITLYEDLKADRKSLGKLPAKWLAYLEEIIRKK
jgi:hypothetical protein